MEHGHSRWFRAHSPENCQDIILDSSLPAQSPRLNTYVCAPTCLLLHNKTEAVASFDSSRLSIRSTKSCLLHSLPVRCFCRTSRRNFDVNSNQSANPFLDTPPAPFSRNHSKYPLNVPQLHPGSCMAPVILSLSSTGLPYGVPQSFHEKGDARSSLFARCGIV